MVYGFFNFKAIDNGIHPSSIYIVTTIKYNKEDEEDNTIDDLGGGGKNMVK